ncbi:hypothetical protein [Bizionia myxarmorum]|uniref:Uncharacterized protein n=1 Tax=Bizionia myxarmorum TaxID=291186 RepID=A0A5D0RCT2_9FLAO|nr:hypothetical protein [Bizionia myxarmorum]TYB78859.1 hypothetical protein ES674_03535 [Bizionia myxarmorum]
MKTYHFSSTHSVYQAILVSCMILTIGIALVPNFDAIWEKILNISITVILVVGIILYQRKRTFSIDFEETGIYMNYTFTKHKIEIPYEDLLELTYMSFPKMRHMIRITFLIKNRTNKLQFSASSLTDSYIEFVKNMKHKNENLKLNVLPSDHIMNHKIQEIYGFKYRKFIKKTL